MIYLYKYIPIRSIKSVSLPALSVSIIFFFQFISACTEDNNSTTDNKTQVEENPQKISSSLQKVIEDLESNADNKEKLSSFCDRSVSIDKK